METSLLRGRRHLPYRPPVRGLFGKGLVAPWVQILRTLQSLCDNARTVWSDQEGHGVLPLWSLHPIWNTERRRAEELLEDDVQLVWKEYDPLCL
jgi:hypothetical protein